MCGLCLEYFLVAQGKTSIVRSWHVRPTLVWNDDKWIKWSSLKGLHSSEAKSKPLQSTRKPPIPMIVRTLAQKEKSKSSLSDKNVKDSYVSADENMPGQQQKDMGNLVDIKRLLFFFFSSCYNLIIYSSSSLKKGVLDLDKAISPKCGLLFPCWTVIVQPAGLPHEVPKRLFCPIPWEAASLSHWTVIKILNEMLIKKWLNARSFSVKVPAIHVFTAIVPSMMIAALYFFDHSVVAQMAQQKEFNLRNPSAYHYDVFLLGIMDADRLEDELQKFSVALDDEPGSRNSVRYRDVFKIKEIRLAFVAGAGLQNVEKVTRIIGTGVH
uniref:Bicarbonate transporter-like transmembrane domain-containing protein n=1 Tax=Lactuca sativa TaxID=4236 RepID=A0A9R1W7K7_LACSA|nr:hypothetical protein LSAT_V11C300120570 [Lactuca sativa]